MHTPHGGSTDLFELGAYRDHPFPQSNSAPEQVGVAARHCGELLEKITGRSIE